MKPAGGISTSKQSLQYLVMLKETLGHDWMNKDLFRFGASRLANDILMQLQKQAQKLQTILLQQLTQMLGW